MAKHFKEQQELKAQHQEAVSQGQSEVSVVANAHFVCFIEKNNKIYKLDGLEEMPLYQKDLPNQDDFLKEACQLAKEYFDADPI